MLPSSLDVPSLDPARVPGWLGLDHVAIAVRAGELEAHVAAWRGLGFDEIHREDVRGADQVREVLLAAGGAAAAGNGLGAVQLLEPLSDDSPVARQIAKGGGRGGLVHVAYRVSDVQVAFDALRAQGQRVIDAAPRPGSRGSTVFFVHPKPVDAAAGLGCLVEIVQVAPHG
jgi:methylmalonyl-CoA/ethylmalonyl-CoA epimerase